MWQSTDSDKEFIKKLEAEYGPPPWAQPAEERLSSLNPYRKFATAWDRAVREPESDVRVASEDSEIQQAQKKIAWLQQVVDPKVRSKELEERRGTSSPSGEGERFDKCAGCKTENHHWTHDQDPRFKEAWRQAKAFNESNPSVEASLRLGLAWVDYHHDLRSARFHNWHVRGSGCER